MAVPNTSTFTLQQVVNEVSPTSNSLTGCFASANSKGFVSSYAGSKNKLSNFRGYSHGSSYNLY
jgi:hypothetical protein